MAPSPEPTPRLGLTTALVFYGAMATVALAWGHAQGDATGLIFATEPSMLGAAVALGLAVAGAVIAASRLLLRRFEAFRRLAEEIRGTLGPLGLARAALLAATSGIAEEMLFRGVMQTSWGLLPATLLFALAHGLPGTRYTTWFAFALVVGLLFGLLYAYTGSLLAPTLAHFTINFFNLLALAPDRTPAPGPPEET